VAGTLILCAGPIGNLGDAPPRLAEALSAADIVYAEDTRRARTLLAHLGVDRPLRSYFVGNEADRAVELGERLSSGGTVALITDAGTPGIADPGLTAVRAAVDAGAEVSGIPGPSAVTMALAVSGMSADRFVFEGFLPRKGRKRSVRIRGLEDEVRTVVMFSSPNRVADDLADLAAALGPDRPVVVCREMTKMHEEVWRGDLSAAVAHWSGRKIRGEVTVVIGGAPPAGPDFDGALKRASALVEAGAAISWASRMTAGETGVPRRDLYAALIRRRDERRAGDGRPPG